MGPGTPRRGRRPGVRGFLLTGSAVPADAPTHTGAGRIITVRMRPMSLAERGLEAPTVSLGKAARRRPAALGGTTRWGSSSTPRKSPGRASRDCAPSRTGCVSLARRLHRPHCRARHPRIRTHVPRPRRAAQLVGCVRGSQFDGASFEKIRDAASAGEADKPARATASPTGPPSNGSG